ncbi:MAG: hypothetical protein VX278_03090 [Myxococcota bacterium]|nr:hypothetical protein [Myxococcota bacterium]
MTGILLTLIIAMLPPAEARRKRASAKDKTEQSADAKEELFAPIEEAIRKRQRKLALELLHDITNDESQSPFHTDALLLQVQLYQELKNPYTAFILYGEILKGDLGSEQTQEITNKTIELGIQLGELADVLTMLTPQQRLMITDEHKDHLNYIEAKEALRKGEYAQTLAALETIQKGSPFFIKKLNLEGITLSQQGLYEQSVYPLIGAQNLLKKSGQTGKLKTIVDLNLARSYYAARNYSAAAEYFDYVPRESTYWLEAQFEKAWAMFRLGDFNKMLGLLQTHTTTFFADGNYPEEELLRIYGFFLLCKFETTQKLIEEFETRYNQNLVTLREWDARTPEDFFSGFTDRKQGELPYMIARHFEFEDRMNEKVDAHKALSRERESLEKLGEFTAEKYGILTERMERISKEEGLRIKNRNRWKIAQIEGMIENFEFTKTDILERQQRILKRASVTGEIPEARRKAKRGFRTARKHFVWPYQGEEWADELGYFQIKTKDECPPGFQ